MNVCSGVSIKSFFFFVSIVTAIFFNTANAQEGATGSIYEKTFAKKTNKAEIFNDSFFVRNLETTHFLTVNALDRNVHSVSIFVNGRKVSKIDLPAFNRRHLIQLELKANNKIEVRLNGNKKSAVIVKILQMSNFYSIFGPEIFVNGNKPRASYSKKFVAPNPRSQQLWMQVLTLKT